MSPWPDDEVILYDGVCVFCSRWIRFIAARDRDRRFRFTAMQSGYGTRLAQAFGINPQDPTPTRSSMAASPRSNQTPH